MANIVNNLKVVARRHIEAGSVLHGLRLFKADISEEQEGLLHMLLVGFSAPANLPSIEKSKIENLSIMV